MKICKSCLLYKEMDQFSKHPHMADGRLSKCKSCIKIEHDFRKTPEGKKKVSYRKYVKQNREKIIQAQKKWWEKNKERMKNYKKSYFKNRYQNDLHFKLSCILRSRLSNLKFRNGTSHIKDLGCSISELKVYLESLFKPGMSWENYGEWEIDHIIPVSKSIDLKTVCHFTNLQPLWKSENRKKSNKLVG